jgi:membrane protease YdiL (CAAX protease family)
MRTFLKSYPLLAFVLMVLLPVHLVLWPLRLSGVSAGSLQPLKILFAFLPTTAALLITLANQGEQGVRALWRMTFLKEKQVSRYGLALVSIASLGAIALLFRYIYDGFYPTAADFPGLATSLVMAPFLLLFPGFTEEYGWRGFLQRRLQGKAGIFLASVLTGLVWGGWHGMDFLLGNWPTDTLSILIFFAYIIGTSIVIGYLYCWSKGSIFVAILAHFSANVVNSFLPVWKTNAGIITPLIFVALLWLTALILLACELKNRYRDGHWLKSR